MHPVWLVLAAIGYAWWREKNMGNNCQCGGGCGSCAMDYVPWNGTNWQGTLYQRLAGVDLLPPNVGERNLFDALVATPSALNRARAGLMPNWRGDLV